MIRVLLSITVLTGTACFDFSRERFGGDGEPCFIEGDCNNGLVCRASGVCVNACGTDSCSGHGACTFDESSHSELCTCDAGYESSGATCVGTSTFRVIHAATLLDPVDIYVSGEDVPAVVGLAYGQVAAITDRGPGVYRFDIRPTGALATATPLYQSTALSVSADASYIVVLSGDLAPTGNERAFSARPYLESSSSRFIHAAELDSIAITGGASTDAVEPLQETALSGAPATGTFSVEIRNGVTASAITSFDIALEASDGPATLVLIGSPERDPSQDRSLRLVLLGDRSKSVGPLDIFSQRAFLYVFNAIADASWLSMAISATLHLSPTNGTQLAYDAVSVVQQPLVTGPLLLSASPMSGSTIATLTAGTGNYATGAVYVLIATGFVEPGVGQQAMTLVEVPLVFPNAAGANVARFVHAAPDAPSVDVSVTLETPFMLDDFTFGTVSDSFAIPIGTVNGALSLDVNHDDASEGTQNFSWAAASAETYLLVIEGLSNLSDARKLGVHTLVGLPNGTLKGE